MATYEYCVIAIANNLKLNSVLETLKKGEMSDEVVFLLKCVHMTVLELALEYAPIRKTQVLKSSHRKIFYREFNDEIVEISYIEEFNERVPFLMFHDCVKVPHDGEFVVAYTCTPLKGVLKTLLPWDEQTLDPRIVGYGAACEYCILNGMTDDAVLWDKRFKDALFKTNLPKKRNGNQEPCMGLNEIDCIE